MTLSREMMRAYLQRWEAVAEVEEAEGRQASIAQRWQKTDSLFRMGIALGLLPKKDEESYDLDQPWIRLRMIYLKGIRQ